MKRKFEFIHNGKVEVKKLSSKSTKKIPRGYYCYSGKNKCPYYRVIKTRPERLSGYCDYLEKGDLELANERMKDDWEMIRHFKNKRQKIRNMTEKEKKVFLKSGSMSLLWDEVKECRIKNI